MKFRKKPVVIDAVQFTDENKDRVFNFVTCNRAAERDPETRAPVLRIQTLEGVMTAQLGDWIIKGVNGEFYPCKPDIFAKTYDVDEAPADLLGVINGLRAKVLEVGESVKAQHKHGALVGLKDSDTTGEMHANITLAYRHLEDARMRLGKVIQAHDGGVSCFDKGKGGVS